MVGPHQVRYAGEAHPPKSEALDNIVGRRIFDVAPYDVAAANASGIGDLEASLDRVKRTGVADVMAVHRFTHSRLGNDEHVADEWCWSPINSPVASPSGELAYIIHRVEDVTRRHRTREARGDF